MLAAIVICYQKIVYNEATITDYGIHWSEDGAASDIQLVSKLLTLFKGDSHNPWDL